MFSVIKITLFCTIIFVIVSESHQEESYDFIIVYDASQPASIDWFKKDFKTYQTMFEGYLRFIFSPCQLIKLSSDKKTMTCDTADPGCLMNKIHSCAITKITDYHTLLNFIGCSFQKEPGSVLKECLTDQKLASAIETCANQEEGFNSCVANSQNVDKPLPAEIVPFFNIPVNFYGYLPFMTTDAACSWMRGGEIPKSCPKDLLK